MGLGLKSIYEWSAKHMNAMVKDVAAPEEMFVHDGFLAL